MTALAPSLTSFLREHLPRERNASPHTVASYAHAFSLLLRYAANRLGRRPTELTIEDLDPDLILGFLSHVEQDRGNTARSPASRASPTASSTVAGAATTTSVAWSPRWSSTSTSAPVGAARRTITTSPSTAIVSSPSRSTASR